MAVARGILKVLMMGTVFREVRRDRTEFARRSGPEKGL
jgi:hypothetical protein